MNVWKAIGVAAFALCGSTVLSNPATAQDNAAAGQTPAGPMVVERITSGFMFAPDFRVTSVDGRTSELVGGYAGVLNDRTFFIGGGGYWMVNGGHDRGMGYGGVVIGWLEHADRPVGFSVKALVGGGESTVTSRFVTVGFPSVDPRHRVPDGYPVTGTFTVRGYSGFFVTEPEASVLFRVTKDVRISAGVGYRLIAAEGPYDDHLSGATGSLALQIGGW